MEAVAEYRGGWLVSEAKKREVLQLLRLYRDWHTAYGGAAELNLESLGQYGPAGMIQQGMAFEPRHRRMLKESFDLLEKALKVLKGEDFSAWMSLVEPYLGDPADPAVVDDWRTKSAKGYVSASRFLERHERAVEALAEYLEGHDLYVVWPARMTTRKPQHVEQMNDEFYALYQKLIDEGEARRKAIQTAVEWCGYSEIRGYEIVRLRETGYKRERRNA